MDPNLIVSWPEAASQLQAGRLGVVPTDTLYGLVGAARQPRVVEHIYQLRRREGEKPLIVLIGEMSDFALLGISISNRTQELFNKVWPGPVTVVVPVVSPELRYLHRGTDSIAFRMPNKPALRELIRSVGPIVAPSANTAGDAPAETVTEAWAYFGDQVFYVDEGRLTGSPSALVDTRDPQGLKVLRPAPGFDIQKLA